MRVARHQKKDAWAAFLVADGVKLGVPAALGHADTIGQGLPMPPPAVRWTLMQLLSMNNMASTRHGNPINGFGP